MKAQHWDGPALPDGVGVYHHGKRVDCAELFLWTMDLPIWAEGHAMVSVVLRGDCYIEMALAWAREVCGYPEETGHCYDSARLEGIEWRNGDETPIPLRILETECGHDGENLGMDRDSMFLAGHENIRQREYWRKRSKEEKKP